MSNPFHSSTLNQHKFNANNYKKMKIDSRFYTSVLEQYGWRDRSIASNDSD